MAYSQLKLLSFSATPFSDSSLEEKTKQKKKKKREREKRKDRLELKILLLQDRTIYFRLKIVYHD